MRYPVLVLFGSFIGVAVGLLIGSLINALFLRLASSWLRIGEFGFDKAFRTAFMSTFVFTPIGTLVLAIWFRSLPVESSSSQGNLLYFFSPANVFYLMAGFVLGHALIFSHRLTGADGSPLRFEKATVLALVYFGICSAFWVGVWFFVILALLSLGFVR
jgi:hypothetical protein